MERIRRAPRVEHGCAGEISVVDSRDSEPAGQNPTSPSPKKALVDLQFMEDDMSTGRSQPDPSEIVRRLEVLANPEALLFPPRTINTALTWCLSIPWDAFEPGTGPAKYEAVQEAALLVLVRYGWNPVFTPAWRLALGENMPLARDVSIARAVELLATLSDAEPFLREQVTRLSAPNVILDPGLREQVHQAIAKDHSRKGNLRATSRLPLPRERPTYPSLTSWFRHLDNEEKEWITGFIRDVLNLPSQRVSGGPVVLSLAELQRYENLLSDEKAALSLSNVWQESFFPGELEPQKILNDYQNSPTLVAINELALAFIRTWQADTEQLTALETVVAYLQRQLAEMYRLRTGRAIEIPPPATTRTDIPMNEFAFPVPPDEAVAYINQMQMTFATSSGRKPADLVWDHDTGKVEVVRLSDLKQGLGSNYEGRSNRRKKPRHVFWVKRRTAAPAAAPPESGFQTKSMGPVADMSSLEYADIRQGVLENLDVVYELSNWPMLRWQNQWGESHFFGEWLNKAIRELDRLRGALRDGSPIKEYITSILQSPENRCYPIRFRVSTTLKGVSSVRYFNLEAQEVEIIFSKEFYNAVMTSVPSSDDANARWWLLLERLYHELGHTNDHIEGYASYMDREHHQVLMDLLLLEYMQSVPQLYGSVKRYFAARKGFGSGEYFRFLMSLIGLTPEARDKKIKEYLRKHLPKKVTQTTTWAMGNRSSVPGAGGDRAGKDSLALVRRLASMNGMELLAAGVSHNIITRILDIKEWNPPIADTPTKRMPGCISSRYARSAVIYFKL